MRANAATAVGSPAAAPAHPDSDASRHTIARPPACTARRRSGWRRRDGAPIAHARSTASATATASTRRSRGTASSAHSPASTPNARRSTGPSRRCAHRRTASRSRRRHARNDACGGRLTPRLASARAHRTGRAAPSSLAVGERGAAALGARGDPGESAPFTRRSSPGSSSPIQLSLRGSARNSTTSGTPPRNHARCSSTILARLGRPRRCARFSK